MKLGDTFKENLSEIDGLCASKPSFHAVPVMSALLFVGALLMIVCIQALAEEPEAAQVNNVIDPPLVVVAPIQKQVPISPYVKANRQHAQKPNEAQLRSLAITVGFPGVPNGRGKRH